MEAKKYWKDWKGYLLKAAAIVLLGLALRAIRLNVLPIFGDEAIYVRWAQVMRAEPSLRFVPLSDGKQPLFMWMVIPFLKIIENPLIAGRLVSALAGVGSLCGVFVLSWFATKSRKVSLYAGLIYSVSPFSVFFDRLALADSLLTFFGIWSLTLAVIVAKYIRLDTAMLTGFALGGALLTKSPALFYALLLPLVFVFQLGKNRTKRTYSTIMLTIFFMITYTIGYGLYNILRLGPNFHMIGIRNADYVYPLSHILTSPFSPFLENLDHVFNYFVLLLPGALIPLVVYGIYANVKNNKRPLLVLSSFAFAPILAVAQFSRTMTARYIYFSIPFIFIIAALSFLTKNKKIEGFLKIIFALFVAHSLFVDMQLLVNPAKANLPRTERSGYLEEWTAGHGIEDIALYLDNRSEKLGEDDQIVVGTEGFFGTLPDGLQIYLNGNAKITVIGIGQPVIGIPKSLKESQLAGNETYLVVNSTRLEADPKKLPLELVSVHPKAVQPDGDRESLLLFRLKEK